MQNKIIGIGLMSGTSMDGLDIALVEYICPENQDWEYKFISTYSKPYGQEERHFFKKLPELSGLELTKANNWFANYCGNAVNEFLANCDIKPDFIASHGHTVFHLPEEAYTLQIGNGANIYALTEIPVVCDFRTVDVAQDGQGAPLVPMGDKYLFTHFELLLNLGGIANISCKEREQLLAFDICPMNIVFNALCARFSPPLEFDLNGENASKGRLIFDLFNELEQLNYYRLPYPKSLGREWVWNHFLPLLEKYDSYPIPDLLNTCSKHFANQISKVVSEFKLNNQLSDIKMLVTGGGAFNKYLLEQISNRLPSGAEIVVPDEQTINFKEALIFGFLGLLRILGKNNCLSSVTGARKDVVGGAIYGDVSPILKKINRFG